MLLAERFFAIFHRWLRQAFLLYRHVYIATVSSEYFQN